MNCPTCKMSLSVSDSRNRADNTTRRTRYCENGHRFRTVETVEIEVIGPHKQKRSDATE